MRRSVRLAFCALAFATFAAASLRVHATDFCVDTPAELYGALLASAVAEQPDDDVTIKLVRGVYNWSGPSDGNAYIVPVNRLRVLGGYDADCSSRVIDANNTVVNGGGALQFTIASTGDDVVVEGMRFQRPARVDIGGLLELGGRECEARGRTVSLRRTIVDFTGTPVIDATRVRLSGICHDLRVENNLIIGGYGNFFVGGSDDDDMRAVIANNTIVGAATTGLTLSKGGGLPYPYSLYNNIFWANGGLGLEDHTCCQPVTIVAFNNSWGGNGAPLAVDSGNSATDPQLDSNRRPIEPASPAINSGNNAIPGGAPTSDLDGGPRIVGSTIDRGAYESPQCEHVPREWRPRHRSRQRGRRARPEPERQRPARQRRQPKPELSGRELRRWRAAPGPRHRYADQRQRQLSRGNVQQSELRCERPRRRTDLPRLR